MRSCQIVTIAVWIGGLALSQSEFDVASVKVEHTQNPATRDGVFISMPVLRGGPGTNSPERIHFAHVTLKRLLTRAYGVHGDQILGGPGWLTSEKYTVDAVVPPGATKEQFDQMLQGLLVQRFKLSFHREERDFTVYELVVASGGSKLRSSATTGGDGGQGGEAAPNSLTPVELDDQGCPAPKKGSHRAVGSIGPINCAAIRGYSIAEVVEMLEMMVALETGSYFSDFSPAHVVDRTGLTGKFDFNLKYNVASRIRGSVLGPPSSVDSTDSTTLYQGPHGDSLFKVLESQLGLRLEKSRARLPVLVIQRIVKAPTPN